MAEATADYLLRSGDTAESRGDFEMARRYFEQGVAIGDLFCLERLAVLLDTNSTGLMDKPRAMQLYRKAWRKSRSFTAANNIAILMKEQGKFPSMARWFRRGADAGDGGAHLELVRCYLEGLGVRRDRNAALRHLVLARNSHDLSEGEVEMAEAFANELKPRSV